MSYGSKSWEDWVLEEKDGIEHIKAAFAAGINVSKRVDRRILNGTQYSRLLIPPMRIQMANLSAF